jgi:hypothetical protein
MQECTPCAWTVCTCNRAASSGVCAPLAGEKKTGQKRPIQYTEEMRYLRRFDQLMQPEFKHAGPPLPTKLTAVYRTRAAADMAMHTARAGTCT